MKYGDGDFWKLYLLRCGFFAIAVEGVDEEWRACTEEGFGKNKSFRTGATTGVQHNFDGGTVEKIDFANEG